jgi:DUF1680 family protein
MDDTRALRIVVRFADWLSGQVDGLISTRGAGYWQQILGHEFGGMNEALYNLYALTKNESHKLLADRFYKIAFMDPLARSGDPLNGSHANTHLPQASGPTRRRPVSRESPTTRSSPTVELTRMRGRAAGDRRCARLGGDGQ